ncbi:large subunit ribosomal protein L35e [Pancytospora philotis]|nr:large subunit ribosomal protein L35e [Pancytospora philotis]
MSDKVCASELRELTAEQLTQELEMFKRAHQQLLQRKHSQTVEPLEIRTARKNVTRCTQIIREKQLQALVAEYKGKKHVPKELREKKNKALRAKLTSKQTNQKVHRARVRAVKYPAKIFAFTN